MKRKSKDKFYLITFSIFLIIVIGIASVQVLGNRDLSDGSINNDQELEKEAIDEKLIGNEWQVVYVTEEPFDINQYYSLESDGKTYNPTTHSKIDTRVVGVYEIELTSPLTSKTYDVVIQVIEDEQN